MQRVHLSSLFQFARSERGRHSGIAAVALAVCALVVLGSTAGAVAALVPFASGANGSGQLGIGTTSAVIYPPVPVVGLPGVPIVKVVGSYGSSFALLADGSLWAWGDNGYGQLGTGTTASTTVPVPIPELEDVVDVATQGYTTIAVRADRTVWAWGNNIQGQCGNGTTASPQLQPAPVLDADDPTGHLTGARAVAMGSTVGLALKEDGTIRSWGFGMSGMLGIGIQANRYTAVPVLNLTNVTAIAAGSGHGMALRGDGTVWTWGANWNGQIGDGKYLSPLMKLAPVQVVDSADASGFLTNVTAISAGSVHSIALKGDGTVRAWGKGFYGALGNASFSEQSAPVVVIATYGTTAPLTGVVSVAAGSDHNLAIRDDGSAWGWGHNWSGQLGRSNVFSKITYPVQILPPASGAAVGTVLVGAGGAASFFVVDVFNRPPVANAGPDSMATLGSNAYLDGSGSHDPDPGDPVFFAWEMVAQPAASAAVLFNANSMAPHFIPDLPGTYVLRLVVTDGKGEVSEPDEVSVSTLNVPPVADAGPDRTTGRGVPVVLDGTRSKDADLGDPLSFAWRLTSVPVGSAASLAGAAGPTPSLIPDLPGDYRAELVVTDGSGAVSVPDEAIVHAFNQRPIADAGPDQSVLLVGTVVALDGAGSWDGNGDPLAYAWELISAPAGSAAALDDPGARMPIFVADVNGEYRLRLTVADPWDESDPDTIVVSFENVRPVAEAGQNLSVVEGDALSLDGSGSHDANLDPLSFVWSLAQVPEGSLATLDDPSSIWPSFVADLPGTYLVTLVVNDGIVDSDMSTAIVTAITSSDALLALLQELINRINALAAEDFKNPNMRNALTNKVNAIISQVTSGGWQGARGHLASDLLGKTDGCGAAGGADKNDWIVSCPAQETIEPLVTQAIALVDRQLE